MASIISSASRRSFRGGRPRSLLSFHSSLREGFMPVCFALMLRMRSSTACWRRRIFCVVTHSPMRCSVASSGCFCSNNPISASASSHLPFSERLKIKSSSSSYAALYVTRSLRLNVSLSPLGERHPAIVTTANPSVPTAKRLAKRSSFMSLFCCFKFIMPLLPDHRPVDTSCRAAAPCSQCPQSTAACRPRPCKMSCRPRKPRFPRS